MTDTLLDPLNEYEIGLVDIIIHGLKKRTVANPITGAKICATMRERGYKITEPRLRKIINHIRANAMLPVVASSHGYYTTNSRRVVQDQIDSMKSRQAGIQAAIEGMEKFLHGQQQNLF